MWKVGTLQKKRLLGSHGAGSIREAPQLLQASWQFVMASKQGRKFNSGVLGGSCCLDLGYSLINSSHLVAKLGHSGQIPEDSAKAPGLPPQNTQ